MSYRVLLLLLWISAPLLRAQDPEIIEGEWATLAGPDSLEIHFEFNKLTVGPFYAEKDFWAAWAREIDSIEPEEAREFWIDLRDSLLAPGFIASFNERMSRAGGPVAVAHTKGEFPQLLINVLHYQVQADPSLRHAPVRLEYILVDGQTGRNQLGRYQHRLLRGPGGENLMEALAATFAEAGRSLAEMALNPPTVE